ncbi:PoNe immunity protein domain-containing protein [Streptococcus pneumoniae]
MRDSLFDKDHFDSLYNYYNEKISHLEDSIYQDTVKDKVRKIAPIRLFNWKFQQLKIMCSRGDSLDDIKQAYLKLFDNFIDIFTSDINIDIQHFIALGLLLNVSEEELTLLKKIKDNRNIIDGFIGLCLSDVQAISTSDLEDLLENYNSLFNIYNSSTLDKESKIISYLQNWYNQMRETYFYGSHKDTGFFYTGYWSFEIAALVKILNIPDDSFKDHKYYPYDLVHFEG